MATRSLGPSKAAMDRAAKKRKKAGVRDPKSHRTPAQEKKHNDKKNADQARNTEYKRNRREAIKKGTARVGDGSHLHHPDPKKKGAVKRVAAKKNTAMAGRKSGRG